MRRCMAGPMDSNIYRNNAFNAANRSNPSVSSVGNQYRNTGNAPWNIGFSESSITYEGILNEYNFSNKVEHELLFKTDYSCAISKDFATEEVEYYLCVEMMSKLDGDGLARHGGRPPMNFSFVLDISGSMSQSFSDDQSKSKLEVAKECLINLLSRLSPQDSFGLILFDDNARTFVQMNKVASHDVGNVKRQILTICTEGGTTIESGLYEAVAMLKNYSAKTPVQPASNNLNRVYLLTDLNPSQQESKTLIDTAKAMAKDGSFLTVVGIGLNFNSTLNYELAKVKGCNSFGVTSGDQFRKQMIDYFNHVSLMVAYDVSLKMTSSVFELDQVYGSPATPDIANGEVLKLDCVCPSPDSKEGITGGVVVLKLKLKDKSQAPSSEPITLTLSYKDWHDAPYTRTDEFRFPAYENENYYQNAVARKAVALVRYVRTMKKIASITDCYQIETIKTTLEKCKQYLIAEIDALNDKTIGKEILIIDTHIANLAQYSSQQQQQQHN